MNNNKMIRTYKENKKFDFKERKENTIHSLREVEYFLNNFGNFLKYIKIYKIFK